MDLKWVVVMAIGLCAVLLGKKNSASKSGTAMVVVGFVLALVGAVFSLMRFFGDGNRSYDIENRYRYVQSKILCEHAKKVCSPSKVCIIVSPTAYLDTWGDLRPQAAEDAYADAAKDAFGSACQVEILYPEYKSKKPADAHQAAEEAKSKIPYPKLLAKDYKKICDKIRKSKPDCVINAYQFPKEQSLVNSLKDLKGFKVAFINDDPKNIDEISAAFQEGGKQLADVIGVVLKKDDYDFYKEPSSVDRTAFDVRFVLATKEDFTQAIQAAKNSK